MKKILFITSFRNINLTQSLEEPFELIPGIKITNNSKIKKKLLTPALFGIIGRIEFDHLNRQQEIVFCEFDDIDLHGHSTARFLLILLLWVKNLFRTAWIIKDNCLECDAAYLLKDRSHKDREYSNNFLAQRTLLANGEAREVFFTVDELVQWRDLNNKVEEYLHKSNSTDMAFFMEKEFQRSGRALQFIQNATTSRNLAFRIAHCCSALEALFSTDSAELSHKLSERVAFFLGTCGYNKAIVFKDIKSCYGIRSKLTHGDSISKKLIEDLPEFSAKLDHYLRIIFQALFDERWLVEHFDAPPAKIDHIFNAIIFEDLSIVEAAASFRK